MVAKLVVFLVVMAVVLAGSIYGLVWLSYKARKLRHARLMAREQRDFETVMEYAEDDALSDDDS